MPKPKKSTVPADLLARIGEDAFPDVTESCNKCHEKGYVCETVHGIKERCDQCNGYGFITRTMDAREEHFWIIHLLSEFQERYVLR